MQQDSPLHGMAIRLCITVALLFLQACNESAIPTTVESDIGKPSQVSNPADNPADFPANEADAARFLMRATFGPTPESIAELMNQGYSYWVQNQLSMPITLYTAEMLPDPSSTGDTTNDQGAAILFWQKAIAGQDQLRQRVAFALSEILVVSMESGELRNRGHLMANYMDIMQAGAFGNYRDTLEAVTYSPAMGIYLTYLGNEPYDPETDVVPDENYAREIMQLFTIGLLELNRDGTPVQGTGGSLIETYDNTDVTGLANVFTGLWWSGLPFRRGRVDETHEIQPLQMNEAFHSTQAKTFLGTTIPEGTSGEASIGLALDQLFNHDNAAPFICRQLIQKLVTSNPAPAYIERVVTAFESGFYQFPNGQSIGSGQRGHLAPVIAAILLDPEALGSGNSNAGQFGKIREPVVRFAHWARAFDAQLSSDEMRTSLVNTSAPTALNQQAYRSPSVFNFFRPGYVAAGTLTANAGLVAPELQITHASSVIGYLNFMNTFVRQTRGRLTTDYSTETALADNPGQLAEHLNLILMAGRMRPETRAAMIAAINSVSNESNESERRILQVQAALSIAVASSEFLVQL